ncbi:hypothetical protein ABT297_31515 [Dactylosporangium sp. NPDC000555]|uniref:hypothetical protein n=1 Tax=Dactylosporangium sp. NPDC000555 TaxID=3154260 RepID=UPI00331E8F48
MRLTVGPHRPSVYWRRRALVAIGLAVLVLLGWLAVRGSGGSKPAAVSSTPAAASGQPAPVTSAPGDLASPSFVQATPDPSTTPSMVHSPPPSNVAPCGDDQIAVTVTTSPSPGVVGGTFTFSVAIVSTAGDWCSRDLGSGAQEVRVLRDGALMYSSDDCSSGRTSDVRAFAAGDAVRYRYTWSSYRITPHNCTLAKTPAQPGTYQVVARVGTKVSAPVDFIINR